MPEKLDRRELSKLREETPFEEVIHIEAQPFVRRGSGIVGLGSGLGYGSQKEAERQLRAERAAGRREYRRYLRESPPSERPEHPRPQKQLKLAIRLDLKRMSYQDVMRAWDLATDISGESSFGPKALRVPLDQGSEVVEALKEAGYPVTSTKEVYTYY